ncbi:MAG TPA: MFS transporter [Rhabdochlamydiaceae bacterium]|nr:MFS transporter [Rhabdochlamydiaceae bacterium]
MAAKSSFLKWALWIAAAVYYFYEFLLRVSPSVMVPELMQSFGITASSVGILSAFYLYAYAPMQLPVGVLMDRYGVKKVLSIACIACGSGALLFAMAQHLFVASLGRLLIGASSAFAFIAMIYVTSHWFPVKKRAFLIGIANSMAMLGASAGTGPLAMIIHKIGWREGLTLFGFFGIALGVIVYFIFKIDRRDAVIEKETAHSKSHILENLKLIVTSKATWINAFAALCFYMTTTAFAGLWGPPFLQTTYGVNKEVAGYAMSMVFAGWLVGGPLIGLLSDFFGKRKMTIGAGILGALICLIPVIYFPAITIYGVYALLFLVGLFSSAELLSFSLAIELNSMRAKATAAAFTNFIISCGDAVVQPLIGFLLDLHWTGEMENGIRAYSINAFQTALSCLPISLVLAGVLLFFVREKRANS